MENLKVSVSSSINLYVNVSQEVEIGQIKTTLTHQCYAYPYKDSDGNKVIGVDINDTDRTDTTYMDLPINGWENWKKLKEFHSSLGIDIDKIIDSKGSNDDIKKAVIDSISDEVKALMLK